MQRVDGQLAPASLEISPPASGAGSKGRIFLSRSSDDRTVAQRLIPELQKLGYEVWSQDNDVLTGDDFKQFMDRALLKCRCTVALLSTDYLASRWCRAEAVSAYGGAQHRLVPLVIEENLRPDGLIASFVYLDVVTQLSDSPASVARLVDKVLADGKPLEESPEIKDYIRHNTFITNISIDDSAVLVGRDAEFKNLDLALSGGGASVAITAIAGMGGVGKSWLARVYAIRSRMRYRGVWLVRAEIESNLIEDLAALGVALKPEMSQVADRVAVAKEALTMIAGAPGRPFLLIFDNAETPDAIQAWRPAGGAHVIITSRWADWNQSGATALPLETLQRDAAIALLLELSPKTSREDAARIAEALDDLPLALTHAGVTLRRAGLTADEYLADLRSRLGRMPPSSGNYRASVRAALEANLDQLRIVSASAPALLEIASVCAADEIPVAIWNTNEVREVLPPELHDTTGVKEALAGLETFSIARVDRDNPLGWTLSLHRLVQQVTRTRLEETGRLDAVISAAAESMATLYPDPEFKRWPTCALFQPHVDAILDPERDARASPRTPDLIERHARYHWQRANHRIAESLFRRAVLIDRARADVSYGASQRWSLYAALVSAKEEKKQIQEELRKEIAVNEATPGGEIALARNLSSLASLLEEEKKYDEAEPMHRRVVEIFDSIEQRGGKITTYGVVASNLGNILRKMGRFEEAEPFLQKALLVTEHRREPNHPHIGDRLSDLAELLTAMGRFAEAEPLLRRALDILQESFGENHATTIDVFVQLAKALHANRKFAEAEPMMRRTLALAEASGRSGDIVNRTNDLGMLMKDMGRLDEAERLLRRSLELEEAASGVEHRRTAGPLNNLGLALIELERPAEAEPLMRRALAIKEQSTDADRHLYASNLALALEKQNKWSEAVVFRRRALELMEAVRGPAYPGLGDFLVNVAKALERAGQKAEGEPFLQRALTLAESSDPGGEAHALALGHLSILLSDTGKLSEARPLMERSLQLFETLHPDGHEDVDTMRGHLETLDWRMTGPEPSAAARQPVPGRRWFAFVDILLILAIAGAVAAAGAIAAR